MCLCLHTWLWNLPDHFMIPHGPGEVILWFFFFNAVVLRSGAQIVSPMCLLTLPPVYLSLPAILEWFSQLSVTWTNTWDNRLIAGKVFCLQVLGGGGRSRPWLSKLFVLGSWEVSTSWWGIGGRTKPHISSLGSKREQRGGSHLVISLSDTPPPETQNPPTEQFLKVTLPPYSSALEIDFNTWVSVRQSKSTVQCGMRGPLRTTGSPHPPSGCWIQQLRHVTSLRWFGLKKEAQRPSDENIFFYELKNKMTVSSQQIPVHNEMNINVYGGIDLEDFFF